MQTLNRKTDVGVLRDIWMPAARHAERGILLIECLIYLGVVLVVIGAALAAFYNALDYSKRLRRNAEDMTRALRVGEQWRADVRSAVGAIRVEKGQGGIAFCIPSGDQEVAYVFSTNQIVRIKSKNGLSEPLLTGIKRCSFNQDNRGTVAAWRWELEFAGVMKAVRETPAFTFIAVPGAAKKQ
ncbi:MAG: hypothetical protein QHJ82_03295 [Verrucomicrobiota bacterium]|nr:hypothetical protein [Verrucomicrobiota bacterium]